jgi:hypothetical protein
MKYLVSPDGKQIAIRSVHDEDGRTAYGVMTDDRGGRWARKHEVEGWTELKPVEQGPEE